LDQFSHVWVTFVFDRNTNVHKASPTECTFKAKVRPPLLGGKKVGLFSTRTPHRPNPIGLTLCKLDRVDLESGRVYLSGVDLCDGTPVLDIKPYVCHDRPATSELKYAAWIPSKEQSMSGSQDVGAPLQVMFREQALKQLELLLPCLHKQHKAAKVYYPDVATTKVCISEVLRLDIRGMTQKRGADGPGLYNCRLGVLSVEFTVAAGEAWIEVVKECSGSGCG
jgi:tRNA-Thr(GGU) m(6)t(6)A37 methyltransferase TsaA